MKIIFLLQFTSLLSMLINAMLLGLGSPPREMEEPSL